MSLKQQIKINLATIRFKKKKKANNSFSVMVMPNVSCTEWQMNFLLAI